MLYSVIFVLLWPLAQALIVAPSGNANTFSVGNGASAYPRANYLANGNILGAYTAFPAGTSDQQLTLVTSNNGGGTWSRLGSAATKPISAGSLDNPYPLQLPSGRILLAYRNHDINSAGAFTVYRITISSSDDGGVSWQYLSDPVVVVATPTKNGVWEPFLRNSATGLQLYYSRELLDDHQETIMLTSTDGGATWANERTVSGLTEPRNRDGMVGVTEVGSANNLIAIFETNTGGGVFSLESVSSSDGGQSWGNRRTVYIAGNGRNAGAPQITNVGGTLVVSFMTNEDTDSGTGSWVDVASAKMLLSSDGGATWEKSNAIFGPPSYWPGLLTLRDSGEFLYLAGYNGVKSQRIAIL